MKTKTDFIETSTTLNETVVKGIQSMLDMNTKFIETQKQLMSEQFESVTKQVKDLMTVNQTNFDNVLKQVETNTNLLTPLMDQFKKQVEVASAFSNETMQKMIEPYSFIVNQTAEVNKEIDTNNENLKTAAGSHKKIMLAEAA